HGGATRARFFRIKLQVLPFSARTRAIRPARPRWPCYLILIVPPGFTSPYLELEWNQADLLPPPLLSIGRRYE
ncbi:hypothetical protein K438DRAFT_1930013, partial [Mycena galopus ATCC 62051]